MPPSRSGARLEAEDREYPRGEIISDFPGDFKPKVFGQDGRPGVRRPHDVIFHVFFLLNRVCVFVLSSSFLESVAVLEVMYVMFTFVVVMNPCCFCYSHFLSPNKNVSVNNWFYINVFEVFLEF